jgi:hypothetical protein
MIPSFILFQFNKLNYFILLFFATNPGREANKSLVLLHFLLLAFSQVEHFPIHDMLEIGLING